MATPTLETVRQWVTELDEALGSTVAQHCVLRDGALVRVFTSEGHELDLDGRTGTVIRARFQWPEEHERPACEASGDLAPERALELAASYLQRWYPAFSQGSLKRSVLHGQRDFIIVFREWRPENGAETNSAAHVSIGQRSGKVVRVTYGEVPIHPDARVLPRVSADQAIAIARTAVNAAADADGDVLLFWRGGERGPEIRPDPSWERLIWCVHFSRGTFRWRLVEVDAMTGEVLLVSGPR